MNQDEADLTAAKLRSMGLAGAPASAAVLWMMINGSSASAVQIDKMQDALMLLIKEANINAEKIGEAIKVIAMNDPRVKAMPPQNG